MDNQIQHCGMRGERSGFLHLRFMRSISDKEDLTTTQRNLLPLPQITICCAKEADEDSMFEPGVAWEKYKLSLKNVQLFSSGLVVNANDYWL